MPYLVVDDAAAAIRFYQEAFGAEVTLRLQGPGDAVGHAELTIPGSGPFALASEFPDMGLLGPKARGGTSVSIDLHVDDCDAFAARAAKAGATVETAPEDQFYGYRAARLIDPYGHRWLVGQKLEDLTNEEMQRRYEALLAGD